MTRTTEPRTASADERTPLLADPADGAAERGQQHNSEQNECNRDSEDPDKPHVSLVAVVGPVLQR